MNCVVSVKAEGCVLTKLKVCDIFTTKGACALISTVTISTITTITSIAAMGLTVAISVVAMVVLLAFLITKELASASLSSSPQLTARFLNVGILPLIVVFAVTVAVKIAEVLA